MRNKSFRVAIATQAHINFMKGNMRDVDHDECMASAGLSADEGLQDGFNKSSSCWAAIINDRPFCCFGAAPIAGVSTYGSPWFLATNDMDIEDAGLGVRKLTRFFINEMLKEYTHLENYVDVRSKAAVKWLKWAGFNFDEARPYGFENRLFHRFWMVREKDNV